MEVKVEYEIPIHFMKRLIQVDNSDEFNFIIKSSTNKLNELNYRTTVNKARVISNKINEIYQIDPTITDYEFEVPNILFKSSNEEEYDQLQSVASTIDLIIKSSTEKVIITKEKKTQIDIILYLLGEKIDDEKSIKIISINESISYLYTQFHDESIKYMSSHIIDMINEDQLFNLDDQIINDIIDSFFNETRKESTKEEEIIFEKLKNSEEIRFVMHFLLQIENDKYTKEMIEYITSNLTDDIVTNEMNVIVKKFVHSICQKEEKSESSFQIEYKGDELKGIISYLKNEYGENLCEKGEIRIYDNGNHSYIRGNILNVINYKMINDFYSNNWGENPVPSSTEGWIEFDFLKRKINLKSYTLRSNLYYHAKSWRILGSNDRNNWDVIDQRINDSSIGSKYKQHRFECENNKQEYYQYIRFIQDDSYRGDRKHNVDLTAIEFFGSIST